jgi:TPR repeat protein
MDAEVLLQIGNDYRFGSNGKPKDNILAMEYFRKAGDLGSADAMNRYGIGLKFGYLGTEDPKGALKWFKKAADHGFSWGFMGFLQLCSFSPRLFSGLSRS